MITVGDQAPLLDLRAENGERIFWPVAGEGGLLVCFVRPLGGPLGRQALVELASLASDTRIVAITPSGGAQVRSWLQQHPAPFPVVSDADGALAKIWGMGRDPLALYTLRGLSQGHLPFRRIWAGLRLGRPTWEVHSDLLPAEILLDDRGLVRFVHLSCSRWEGPDLDGLRGVLGKPAGRAR